MEKPPKHREKRISPLIKSLAADSPERKPSDILPLFEKEFPPKHTGLLRPLVSITAIAEREARASTKREWELQDKLREINQGNYDGMITQIFDYLAATRDLEIDSERTKKIQQSVVDKLLAKHSDIHTQVVIMRKGESPNAFVTPDGTIFISQSMINAMDTYDELAAVMAHEVTHLIHKTSIKIMLESTLNRFGIGWVHEMVADQNAVSLLEEGGFKASAFATAIEKLPSSDRDIEHQSSTMRATQSYINLGVINRKTSTVAVTPLDENLKGPVRATNNELFFLLQESENIANITQEVLKVPLNSLHPYDLLSAYESVVGTERSFPTGESVIENELGEEIYSPLILALDSVIAKRLLEKGYTPEQAQIFSFFKKPYPQIEDAYFFEKPRDFVNICKAIVAFENADLINRMHNDVFFQDHGEYVRLQKEHFGPQPMFPAIEKFFDRIERWIRDEGVHSGERGIPVTKTTLLEGIKFLTSHTYSGRHPSEIMLATYISDSIIVAGSKTGKDIVKEVQDFLQQIEKYHLPIEGIAIRNYAQFAMERSEISLAIQQEILRNIMEFFGIKEEVKVENIITNSDIDRFLDILGNQAISDKGKLNSVDAFFDKMDNFFREKGMTDAERLPFAMQLLEKLYDANIQFPFPIGKYIADPSEFLPPVGWQDRERVGSEGLTQSIGDRDAAYGRFIFGSLIGLQVFQEDKNEFYQYMHALFDRSGIDFSKLSKIEAFNLAENLLSAPEGYGNRHLIFFGKSRAFEIGESSRIRVSDFTRFFEMPLMKQLVTTSHTFKSQNLSNFVDELYEYEEKLDILRRFNFGHFDIFSDRVIPLIIGKDIYQLSQSFLHADMQDKEIRYLVRLLERYYPDGRQKDALLGQMHNKYLRSADISLQDKMKYVISNIEKVGYEGIVTIAEQTTRIEDFREFMHMLGEKAEKYLDGNQSTTILAAGDYGSSLISDKFSDVFRTALIDDQTKQEVSTAIVEKWLEIVLHQDRYSKISYDQEQRKFVVPGSKREGFRSVHDLFESAKNLSQSKRAIVALKLLTDTKGALVTKENRKELADLLIGALELHDGFLKDVVTAAALEADAKRVAFPIAQIIGPLLFRAFDEHVTDINRVLEAPVKIDYDFSNERKPTEIVTMRANDVVPAEEMMHVLETPTRDIKIFGPEYFAHQSSPVYALAQESDSAYELFTQTLQSIVASQESQEQTETSASQLDIATEALIRAVEVSGALGARSLQLTTQFEDLPPAIDARFAQALDSNQGMDKLRFWINLDKLAREDPKIEAFVKNIELHEYLGGGSLQTTFHAVYTNPQGKKEDIVIRMKNPNVEHFVDEVFTSSQKILEHVSTYATDQKSIHYAQIGLMLLELSRDWCKADLADSNYETSDDQFRVSIADFNKKGNVSFYAPRRILSDANLKVEALGEGKTANQTLRDSEINSEIKQGVVKKLAQFFLYQINTPSYVNEHGEKMYLIHSDPHLGNFLVDEKQDIAHIGVIDRDYYLHLPEEDVEVLRKLVYSNNPLEFADAFVDRLLTINNVNMQSQREEMKNRAFTNVGMQLASGETNSMSLLRTLMKEFTESDMRVPVELRVMLRNIEAFKRLLKGYGVELSQQG